MNMFAIAKFSGRDYIFREGIKIIADRNESVEVGKDLILSDVSLLNNKGEIAVNPTNVEIHLSLVAHYRDKKIIVFKKKRRKGYRRKRGHRQEKTLFVVKKIVIS